MKSTKRKQTFALLTAIFLLVGLLFVPACTSSFEEDELAPQVAAKTVVTTQDFFAEVPNSFSDSYHIQLVFYSDGTVGYKQEIVPIHPSQEVVSFASVNANATPLPVEGYKITFSNTGWMIPFDPSEPPQALGGEQDIHCDCYGKGDCGISNVYAHPNGGIIRFFCIGTCDEDCIRRVGDRLEKAVLINAPQIQAIQSN